MKKLIAVKISLAALAVCCAMASHAAAQNAPANVPVVSGASNEDSKAWLDFLAQTAGQDKLIIMVARLGEGESSRGLGWRRLRSASAFLEAVRGVSKQRMVLASGERTPGQGRIEVYLDGKLSMVFVFGRNKNFAPEG